MEWHTEEYEDETVVMQDEAGKIYHVPIRALIEVSSIEAVERLLGRKLRPLQGDSRKI